MNNLLSSCCDPLPSNTTLCFGAWIQGESVGGWPFICEGIVISPTVSFFAAHKAVPDLQGGCFYRVDIPEACCGLVGLSDKAVRHQGGGRLTQNIVT